MLLIKRQTEDLAVYRGDSIQKLLIVLDPDDAVVDLTGCTAAAQIRTNVDGDVVVELGVEITSPTDGEVLVSSTTGDTQTLDLGPDEVGVWDLEVGLDEATPLLVTAFRGDVTFVKDVTDEN